MSTSLSFSLAMSHLRDRDLPFSIIFPISLFSQPPTPRYRMQLAFAGCPCLQCNNSAS
jgi:hypothetical protein